MDIRVAPDSPVPLYHQIAETIRYRIATGVVRAGSLLPPLRDAAERWKVNLHTVRHAYAELESQGLVVTRPPQGTVVLDVAGRRKTSAGDKKLIEFVERFARQAGERFGISRSHLAALLTVEATPHASGRDRLFVVECSRTQCADLAQQIEQRWEVSAEPWCLDRPDEPPQGEIVATYFHFNDIRRRWPQRLAEVRFLAIRPDETLPDRVAQRCGKGQSQLLVCERDETMVANVAADLSSNFDRRRYLLTTIVTERPGELLVDEVGPPILFAPRVWGGLSAAERAHPRAFEVRYVFDDEELESLGRELHWPSRRDAVLAGESR